MYTFSCRKKSIDMYIYIYTYVCIIVYILTYMHVHTNVQVFLEWVVFVPNNSSEGDLKIHTLSLNQVRSRKDTLKLIFLLRLDSTGNVEQSSAATSAVAPVGGAEATHGSGVTTYARGPGFTGLNRGPSLTSFGPDPKSSDAEIPMLNSRGRKGSNVMNDMFHTVS